MYKQNILCSFTTRKQLRKGKKKKDRSIKVTQEDGLKLVQNKIYKLIYILVILLSLLPPQDSGTEAGIRGGTLNSPA